MSQSDIHGVTIAYGDGIGPEIMSAARRILEAANAPLRFDVIEIGEKVYTRGLTSGIAPESWDILRKNPVFLKAPITTPQGGGYKSLNVTIRKSLGLYANVRPCVSYYPFVDTHHVDMDLVIVRENEEDTYAGIEHQQTDEVTQCLKLVSRPGCEKIIRYAFEFARLNERRHVTCFSKDNIMKLTDGLFHRTFDLITPEYPDITVDHRIVDIGTALIAHSPEDFDIVVMPNLYGDIVSDVAAQIAGSVGMAGSANIGDSVSMFEAIHGSAPDIAGQDIANPSGLINGAVMMLVHLNLPELATTIHNAWLTTIEDGIHTGDVYKEGTSKERVGTQAFADAVIERFGRTPQQLKPVSYAPRKEDTKPFVPLRMPRAEKKIVGVDVFLHWDESDRDPNVLGEALRLLESPFFTLKMITNRGVKVFPDGFEETFCTDHWRCRFTATQGSVTHGQLVELLLRVANAGFDFIKTENLCTFDGKATYSLGQGE